jgi:N-dimethylarginine dimethylaminohydrolase
MATVIPRLFSSAADLKAHAFSLTAIQPRKEPQAILMCEPTYFDVVDAKNPFMANNVGACDTALAKQQWNELRATYEKLGYQVHTMAGAKGLEDMVFSANQVLPGEHPNGAKYVVLANMVHASRRREVEHYAAWFESRGYELLRISPSQDEGPRFEGQGDAIWHPGKNLLWGGYGWRTEKAAYNRVAELTGAHVLLLKLVNEAMYHLDVALCPLDAETALIAPYAFETEGVDLIRSVFKTVIEIPEEEGKNNFAGNCFVLGKNVILQKGSPRTCDLLRNAGYTPIEVDTSEYMKSGGSVFCMKMMVY